MKGCEKFLCKYSLKCPLKCKNNIFKDNQWCNLATPEAGTGGVLNNFVKTTGKQYTRKIH